VHYIPNIDAREAHGNAFPQSTCIVEIRSNRDFTGKPAAGPAHHENEDGERNSREQDGESYAELRPFQLLLARQWARLTTQHNSKGCAIFGKCLKPSRNLERLRVNVSGGTSGGEIGSNAKAPTLSRCEEWELTVAELLEADSSGAPLLRCASVRLLPASVPVSAAAFPAFPVFPDAEQTFPAGFRASCCGTSPDCATHYSLVLPEETSLARDIPRRRSWLATHCVPNSPGRPVAAIAGRP